MTFTTVSTAGAAPPFGAYSQGRRIGPFLQVCGQLAVDPATGTLLKAGVGPQTRRALEQATAVLEAGGANWEAALMVRVYLADVNDFEEMDVAYRQFLNEPFPPRTTVTAGLFPGAYVEIDVLAVLK
ncbi:RidA family protein [Actinomadura luteofluorescens]|uniref:RidA family protein n=1 Tax=Actinomadura TaxID=1988 RepID=UPI003404021C